MASLLIVKDLKRYWVDGETLRALREERGLSQRDLAALIGIGAPHLCKIELAEEPIGVSEEVARRIEEWRNAVP